MKAILGVLMLCSVSVFSYAEPVDINKADAQTISNALVGIGPKKADAIVQYRTEHGEFKTLKDLESVSGIGEKTIKLNEKDILIGESAVPVAPQVNDKKAVESKQEVSDKK